MPYTSRSDFLFNIREFADSLHADDIKAVNEGLGLGKVVTKQSAVVQRIQNQINHNEITTGIPKLIDTNQGFQSRGREHLTTSPQQEPKPKSRLGWFFSKSKSNNPKLTKPQVKLVAKPNVVKRKQARKANAVSQKSAGWLTRFMAIIADLFVVVTCLGLTVALTYKLAIRFGVNLTPLFATHFDFTKPIGYLKAATIVLTVLYFCYILYWLIFRIAGLRTVGKIILRPKLDKSVTNENINENMAVNARPHKKF